MTSDELGGNFQYSAVKKYIRHTRDKKEVNRVFERFTDRARRVVVLAQEEAGLLNHKYIGTGHFLLGMLHENDMGGQNGIAHDALEAFGVKLEDVRRQIVEILHVGYKAPTGHIPFSLNAKRVMEFSLREALQLGHNYIGAEHILLGMIRKGDGVAVEILLKLDVNPGELRAKVMELMTDAPPDKEPQELSIEVVNGALVITGDPANGGAIDLLLTALRDGKVDFSSIYLEDGVTKTVRVAIESS